MRSDGACVLGTQVGDTAFVQEAFAQRLPKIQAAHSLIAEMDDPQIELHLLRAFFRYCKVNHLARTVPAPLFRDFAGVYDKAVRDGLSSVLQHPVSTDVWCQAGLPLAASQVSAAAFLGSVRAFAALVVDLSGPDSPDPDVETARDHIVAHLAELPQAADVPPLDVLYTQEGSARHALSGLVHAPTHARLLRTDPRNAARLRALTAPSPSHTRTTGWWRFCGPRASLSQQSIFGMRCATGWAWLTAPKTPRSDAANAVAPRSGPTVTTQLSVLDLRTSVAALMGLCDVVRRHLAMVGCASRSESLCLLPGKSRRPGDVLLDSEQAADHWPSTSQ
jgi:hypothetical protein